MEGEFEGEWSGDGPGASEVFNEAEQMELAAELLEVRDEAELDRFLGNIFKKAARPSDRSQSRRSAKRWAVCSKAWRRKRSRSPAPRQAPSFGGPLGAQIGGGLASAAGRPWASNCRN